MTEQDLYTVIAEEQKLKIFQVVNTVELLDAGSTVPFIARYRKEATGMLDEEQIRTIRERMKYLRMLEERKATILHSIEEQGKLTPELAAKIKATMKLQELEDLYLPYKPKKRTRATVAKEKGLEPLAQMILEQQIETGTPEEYAAQFINPEKGVESAEEALTGAVDIVAETVSDDAEVRKIIRGFTRRTGSLSSVAKKPEEKSEYENYYEFREPVKRLVPHRILAINRGEKEVFARSGGSGNRAGTEAHRKIVSEE